MARCVIVSACPVSPALAGLLRADDYLIACDAGYHNCEALGRRPDAVVGDFDSAPCPVAAPGEDLVVLPHVKDDTDTEYAAKLAFREGYTEVLLLGCLGGRRLEHTLANLCTGLGLEQRGRPDPHLPAGGLLLPVGVSPGRPGRRGADPGGFLRADRRHPDCRVSAGGQQRVRPRLGHHHPVGARGRAGGDRDQSGLTVCALRGTFRPDFAYNGAKQKGGAAYEDDRPQEPPVPGRPAAAGVRHQKRKQLKKTALKEPILWPVKEPRDGFFLSCPAHRVNYAKKRDRKGAP